MNHLRDALKLAKTSARLPRKRVQREHAFQSSVIPYLELVLPPEAVFTSIDHADASKVSNALKAGRGVLPGIPDIWIVWSPDPKARLQVVVVLETKSLTGRLGIYQKVWRDVMQATGVYWSAPRTLEQVAAALAETPIPLRKVALQ